MTASSPKAASTNTASATNGNAGRRIARPIGFTFFGIGLVLLVLIIYAMVTRLTH